HNFISILPPDMRSSDVKWPANSDRWMSTFFEDIRPEHLLLVPLLEKQFGRQLQRFDEAQADAIIDFLVDCNNRPEEEMLYVNCVAGISRSGAIVTFATDIFNLNKDKFRKDNPYILPNNLVMQLLKDRWNKRQK
ncbi:hypothetical protein, partial [Lacticaseibacillus paracasei]|uniref:hypothetical protein n=1 Tax=Lacticaseibacillus paracasei TaxID=1597 RepID=UPI0019521B42